MAKSLQLRFRSHPLPDDWNGDIWEFQDALTERLVAESGDQIGLFVTGSTAPTSNMGPWLKDGEGWYFWDDTTGTYIPDEAVTSLASQVASNTAQISIILTTYADKDYAEAKMEEAITASTNYTNGQITNLSTVYATNNYVEVIAEQTLEASTDYTDGQISSLSSVYATNTYVEARMSNAITVSAGYTDAEILEESIVRAQDDGYLSGMYVLKVEAGSRVAGMYITAIDDPSGWSSTSEVAFRSDVFKIYNGTSNVAPFQVVGGEVRVTGNLVLVPTDIDGLGTLATEDDVNVSQVTGLGALATQNDVSYSSVTGTKPPSNADVTLSAVNGGLSITGGGIILDGGGAIRGGMTSFGVGKGFFLGYDGGEYKFMVGDPSGAYIKWDGSNWTENGWPTSGGGPTGTAYVAGPIPFFNITGGTAASLVVSPGARPVNVTCVLSIRNVIDPTTITVQVTCNSVLVPGTGLSQAYTTGQTRTEIRLNGTHVPPSGSVTYRVELSCAASANLEYEASEIQLIVL